MVKYLSSSRQWLFWSIHDTQNTVYRISGRICVDKLTRDTTKTYFLTSWDLSTKIPGYNGLCWSNRCSPNKCWMESNQILNYISLPASPSNDPLIHSHTINLAPDYCLLFPNIYSLSFAYIRILLYFLEIEE